MYFHTLELLAFGFLAALELINGEGGKSLHHDLESMSTFKIV